jgi:hypothetical protein
VAGDNGNEMIKQAKREKYDKRENREKGGRQRIKVNDELKWCKYLRNRMKHWTDFLAFNF